MAKLLTIKVLEDIHKCKNLSLNEKKKAIDGIMRLVRAKKNKKELGFNILAEVNDKSIANSREKATGIIDLFWWGYTKEDYDFWSNIDDKVYPNKNAYY